ncbi:MAG: adenine phosphoribosyltransferase [Candidatus Micrarchaeota archaeon]|nr:adenine phosphoribosyltransferase [Candidatus Micrarchaeota archaeon]
MDGHDAKPAPHNLKSAIRTVPHWPKQGVMFRDVTILLKDKRSFKCAIDLLADRYMDYQLDSVAGIEARGFIFGAALAHRLGIGFIPIRKAGKLPSNTISEEYSLEYGKEKMEIHSDALSKGDNILLVDDLLATGGTALGACRLISRLGGNVVECCFVICLPELGGKKKLQEAKYDVFYLMEFEGE